MFLQIAYGGASIIRWTLIHPDRYRNVLTRYDETRDDETIGVTKYFVTPRN